MTWHGQINDFVSLWLGVGYLEAGDAVKNYRNSKIQYNRTTQSFEWNQNYLQGRNQLAKEAYMAYAQINAAF
ncbi:hypothetical protein LFX15_01010 [Leptospira levettii]|nr:hypothetical protein [Leptospira levettii]MCG6146850.1 hypothetical protein [Leptospira levettii]